MTDKTLSRDDLNLIVDDVLRAFEIELMRQQDETLRQALLEQVLKLFFDTNLYAFFTPVHLESLTTRVFSNGLLRDFVLNLTERSTFFWTNSDISFDETLCSTVAKAITVSKKYPADSKGMCLIPESIAASISASTETVSAALLYNPWLLVCYILVMHFASSEIFAEISKSLNNPAIKRASGNAAQQ
jgi:hypothetical protein